jgi:hypothetical protein
MGRLQGKWRLLPAPARHRSGAALLFTQEGAKVVIAELKPSSVAPATSRAYAGGEAFRGNGCNQRGRSKAPSADCRALREAGCTLQLRGGRLQDRKVTDVDCGCGNIRCPWTYLACFSVVATAFPNSSRLVEERCEYDLGGGVARVVSAHVYVQPKGDHFINQVARRRMPKTTFV